MSDTGGSRLVASSLLLAVIFAVVAVVLAAPDTAAQLLGWFVAGMAVGVVDRIRLRRRPHTAPPVRGTARIVVIGIGVVVVAAARVFFGEGFVPVLMAFGSGAVLVGAIPRGAKMR
ncbi:MAG: hypothetical protein ABJB55_05475 [Actinomycetota bacterium]